MISWDILVATVDDRAETFAPLLERLAGQLIPGVGLLIHRCNFEVSLGAARMALLNASKAEHVSFVDDDDWVEDDYVERIAKALKSDPDSVGITARFTYDGDIMPPIFISSAFRAWTDVPAEGHRRDFFPLAPIRRRFSLRAGFDDSYPEDMHWAQRMRGYFPELREVVVDEPVYRYQQRTAGTAQVWKNRENPPEKRTIAKPEYPGVVWVTE